MKIYYNKGDKELIEFAINNNENILLEGESGTGKTSMIKVIAEERGKNLIRINLNGQVSVEDIIGYKTVNNGCISFVEGALITAMKNGDWIVFDELNSANPEVLFTLQSLLDDDKFIVLKEWNNEKVIAHPDFRFFATQNPPTNYAGTKELNGATLSRFGCVLSINYSEHEADILIERTAISNELANALVNCANLVREMNRKGELLALCTTRDLLQVAKMIKLGVDKSDAVEVCIINKAKIEEREELKKIFELNLDMRFKVKINGKVTAMSSEEVKELTEKLEKQAKDAKQAKKELEDFIAEREKTIMETADKISELVYAGLINKLDDKKADLGAKKYKELKEILDDTYKTLTE